MATIIYTGAGNTADWSDGHDWKGGVAPGGSDTALLAGGPDSTVTAPVTVNNLMILSAQTVTFDGAVTTYGLGNCKGLMVCVGGTAVFAPGSSLADGGVLQVGVRSTGTLIAIGTQAHATTLQAERTELGKLAAGIGMMTIDGASLSDTAGLTVGEAGRGNLAIIDGGRVSAAHLVIGLDAGASGQISLSGGSTLSLSGDAAVGVASKGTGTLSVTDSSTVHVGHGLSIATGSGLSLAGGTVQFGDTQGWAAEAAGATISGYGTLTTHGSGGFSIDGTVDASGGTLDLNGRISGSGTIDISANATLQLDSKMIGLPKIAFAGPSSTLALAQGATVTSEIDGFTHGDVIEMAGITGANWNADTHLLTLTGAGKTIDRIHLAGTFSADQFAVSQHNGVGVISLQS